MHLCFNDDGNLLWMFVLTSDNIMIMRNSKFKHGVMYRQYEGLDALGNIKIL